MSETSTPKRGTLSAIASAANTMPVRRAQRRHPKPARGECALRWTRSPSCSTYRTHSMQEANEAVVSRESRAVSSRTGRHVHEELEVLRHRVQDDDERREQVAQKEQRDGRVHPVVRQVARHRRADLVVHRAAEHCVHTCTRARARARTHCYTSVLKCSSRRWRRDYRKIRRVRWAGTCTKFLHTWDEHNAVETRCLTV